MVVDKTGQASPMSSALALVFKFMRYRCGLNGADRVIEQRCTPSGCITSSARHRAEWHSEQWSSTKHSLVGRFLVSSRVLTESRLVRTHSAECVNSTPMAGKECAARATARRTGIFLVYYLEHALG